MANYLEARGLRGYRMTHDATEGIIFSEQLEGEGSEEKEMIESLAESMKGKRGGMVNLEKVAHPTDSKGVAFKGTVKNITNLGYSLQAHGYPRDRVAKARGTALLLEPA